MKTAIVSGANGFIGNALVKELLSQGYSVQALVHNEDSNMVEHRDLSVINFSLEDIHSLKNILKTSDIFFHFAWNGSAGKKRSDTRIQLNNAQWTIDSLRLAKDIGCSRFVCAGSIVEYETVATMQENGNKPGSNYIYGGGKLAAHIMCKSVAAEIGIDLLWGLITNAYGPGELSPRLVNSTLQKVLKGEIPKFTSGTQNYDFVYIDDVAKAFRLIGEKGKAFSEYVIGSSKAKSLKEFLLEMNQAVAEDMIFVFGDMPFTGTDLPLSTFDSSRTEADTGFKATVSFAEGTKQTIEWIRNQG